MLTRRDFLKFTAAGGALASMGNIAEAKNKFKTIIPDGTRCLEGACKIPLIGECDIVVVGGSTRAIAAASAAAKTGCSVYVVTPMPYLGDDICGSLLYELQDDEKPQTALARKIFVGKDYPTPLHVKKTLENELIDNDISFLYSSFVTEPLVDNAGNVAGVVIANRSGRQAIKAKSVIDATQNGAVAKMANLAFQPFASGDQEFAFTVVGNTPKNSPEILRSEKFEKPLKAKGKEYPVTRYTFKMPMTADSYDNIMVFEQKARSAVWDCEQVDSSDLLWYIPNQTIKSKGAYFDNAVVRKLPVSAFQPVDSSTLWVLGPAAEMRRGVAAKIMRPMNALFMGELLGEYIGNQTKLIASPLEVRVLSSSANGSPMGKIGEILKPLRPALNKGVIASDERSLPILGSFDVVVLGGGTAGASAGISAARHGASTLMLEQLHALGGLSTIGMIGRYWDGFRGGFTDTLNKGVYAMASSDHPRRLPEPGTECPADWKMEWLRREYLNAGGSLWFGVIGCGALYEGNQIKGVVVATPFGRGVILSKVLIDSTGSADIAIAAGAPYESTGANSIAVQGAGTGIWAPGDYYNNNDWLFVDDSDVLDVSRAFIQAKEKFRGEYDIVKMPQTRERRRIIGDYVISVCDVINKRRYPDTISFHKSSFDTHGMVVDPYFMLAPPEERHTIYDADVPLRSLLPRGMEGIMCTGLGASADRDAMPVIRMQPCLQNQGYAVGYLAAESCKDNKPLRKVDIKKIQRYLVKMGNLPERVLSDKEFKGYSKSEMRKAASTIGNNYQGLEILLANKEECIGIIEKELPSASPEARLNLASVLCMLGNAKGSDILADAIKDYPSWDTGWHYTGMGQFGMSLSRLDALITALGKSKQKEALPIILEKASWLTPEDYFSHFRAISMATESIGSQEAAPLLAGLLCIPGVRNHSMTTYREARNKAVPGGNDVSTRNLALKELHLARALYLCGDDANGAGQEVLRRYANGLQAHYARYASEILEKKS